MKKRIHIVGASGSGTTTLGKQIAEELGYSFFDTDDYYWQEKFTEVRTIPERLELLRKDLASDKWILSGSLYGWGDELVPLFEGVIFLSVPTEERMKRLALREQERYGEAILPGGLMHEQSVAFLEWASTYESAGPEMRSRIAHEEWLAQMPCPILRLEGLHTKEERVRMAIGWMEEE